MAMVLVISGFNGIEHVVEEMYSVFDADIQITRAKGKRIDMDEVPMEKLRAIDGVQFSSAYIEETTILKNDNDEGWVIARMKGVQPEFLEMSDMDRFVKEGETMINMQGVSFALMGTELMSRLQAYIHDPNDGYEHVRVLGLIGDERLSSSREDAVKDTAIYVSARFSINAKYDGNYFIVPLEFASALLEYDNDITGIELGLAEGADPKEVKEKVQKVLGSKFKVMDKEDQNALLFQTHRSEKWIVFLILCFIFVLSTFNMIASLTMLIMDKREDIATIKALGADQKLIRRVFIAEGLLINFLGIIVGIVLGLAIAVGQMQFGWVSMGPDAVIAAFPVRIVWIDLFWIFLTVFTVGLNIYQAFRCL